MHQHERGGRDGAGHDLGGRRGEAEDRLGAHEEPVLAAADAYGDLHLLLVSGIIVSAIGLKAAVGHVADLWCAFLPVGGDPPQ